MICQLYDSWYRENCINMLSDQNTAMNWNLSLMTACIIVPECTIKVLKHWKLYKDAYILQESFATTDKSYPPPCRNYLLPLYLSVTLYACAQRVYPYPKQKAFQFMAWTIPTWNPPPSHPKKKSKKKNQVQLKKKGLFFFLTRTAKDFNLSNYHVCNTTFSR